jgi:type IV secretory pathway VirB4 component
MFVKTKSPFGNKKIVLVIDEFDQIYETSDALQAQVLQTLHNLRQMWTTYNLWV